MDPERTVVSKAIGIPEGEDYGAIEIRVFVLEKRDTEQDKNVTPDDYDADEPIIDYGKKAVTSYLETPKKGRHCCVFLINGQRQHAMDNSFIQHDLQFKYLRNRMVIVVDVDGMKDEAISHLMQGSRQWFYEGKVFEVLMSRVAATLKADPDLQRLEAEAEDEISNLKRGEEAVKEALDKLIEDHHEKAIREALGDVAGISKDGETTTEGISHSEEDVVVLEDASIGVNGSYPVLQMSPQVETIKLKPNDVRRISIFPEPIELWRDIREFSVETDPKVNELVVGKSIHANGADVSFEFNELDGFDRDEYPIETLLRVKATFRSRPETRVLEKRVVIAPPRSAPPIPDPELLDNPTYLRVSSRQPIKMPVGGPDVHVRLRWDGKDYLASGHSRAWRFSAKCREREVTPNISFTVPKKGRFELLIPASDKFIVGTYYDFDVLGIGPEGKTLKAVFTIIGAELPEPRKTKKKTLTGRQRKPPYELRYIEEKDYHQETCWANPWTIKDAGAFVTPSSTAPLILIVNQDMATIKQYREYLISKKMAESTVKARFSKYTSHIAYHLYLMYLSSKNEDPTKRENPEDNIPVANREEEMRKEINRVSETIIKMMEVL